MRYTVVYKDNRHRIPTSKTVNSIADMLKRVAWIDTKEYRLLYIKRVH